MVIYIRTGPEEPTEAHKNYWLALGRFIHAYALTERETFTLLLEKAGVSRPMAQALFSGSRVKNTMSLLKRIADVRGQAVPANVTRAMDQLGHITGARDKIVHHGATIHDGAFTVTDKHRTIPRQAYEQPFPPETINEMTDDLETIGASFYTWLCGPNGEGFDASGVSWNDRALAPWRYTPPEQAGPQQPRRGKNPKRGHRPRPCSE